ncbi:MAG TPA: acetyl-CoA carboxylase biotin carboxyl carrier protein [Microscillaceae bacterium]|jgi:acetyl-CoA carboxylase biotin carboxyl carrier protein|nr:acetyl-CoA carboxylase biotin carboxyl carrier protein [Microscillaceae bacterium]
MKAKEIQDLITFIAESGLDEVNIETESFKLSVKRNNLTFDSSKIQPSPVVNPVVVNTPQVIPPQVTTTVESKGATSTDESKLIAIKSPMIGTFYRASSPDTPAFANVGDDIKAGQVVCIIEAMKLFNEIESEISGKIVKVLVENASPVEYDQPLFLVDPS